MSIVGALGSAPVLAAGPGLPRTYQVQRIDSPNPVPGGLFSLGMNAVGDLNRDGAPDLLVPQVPGFNQDGQVFVYSGATGQVLDTIPAPDPGGEGARAQFGLLGIWYAGNDRGSAPFSDLGSCAGGTSGQTCPSTVGPPDGVPELLVGATGVDVGGVTDAGRNYVLDGATRAVLKRIDTPPADRQAGQGFGRELLTPVGMSGCAGNLGVGPCPPTSGSDSLPEAVRIGDMDGGSRPDLVLSARRYTETTTTAFPGSHCANTTGATCASAGRVYIYRGEDIAGSNPSEILDGVGAGETVRTLKNPAAQADDPQSGANPESFGNDLLPVGDLGRCTVAAIPAGDRCPAASTTNTPDGRPDFVASSPGVDLPVRDPDPSLTGVGMAFLIDGATGSVLFEYHHPELQRGAGFGGTFEQTLPVGDLGDTGQPDVFLAAPNQNGRYVAQGRGYVMNGNIRGALTNFARLDDPTPAITEKNFGGSVAGVGDLVGGPATPANEVLVGASGPNLVQQVQQQTATDIHFFNAATETVLQSIANPDGQVESAFGDSIEPLGDVNGDGFLDFGVGAFRASGAAGQTQGRFFIFRSDNSPAPAPGQPPAPGGPQGPTGPPGASAAAIAGRVVELSASKASVASGTAVRLSGAVEAFSNPQACQAGQPVALQRRGTGASRYATIATTRTDAQGDFASTIRPSQTASYRALVGQSGACLGAASDAVTVAVPPRVTAVTSSTRLLGRVVRFQLRCPRGSVCSGTVKLRTAGRVRRPGGARQRITLGTKPFQIPGGGRRTTRLIVSRRNAAALRTVRRVPLNVFITSRDTEGRSAFTRDRLTLRTR
ncbi:MAG TPA: integrin alpha [Solirubrobacteraceae bacterium]|nr:integrin alpha [Solirubrobacteraceae bacterium]